MRLLQQNLLLSIIATPAQLIARFIYKCFRIYCVKY
uniref:Uncharacterized protein n=1 Tax=Arundo donax TaxID=35708 RepID=A0A0A8YB15_ARUDO